MPKNREQSRYKEKYLKNPNGCQKVESNDGIRNFCKCARKGYCDFCDL